MTTNSPVEKMINRLVQVEWAFQEKHIPSCFVLAALYLRRYFAYLDALGLDAGELGSSYSNFNIAQHIDPNLEISHESIEQLKAHFSAFRQEWFVGHVDFLQDSLINAVYWAGVQEHPKVIELNLPAPYEPLVRVYERGGMFGYGEFGYMVAPSLLSGTIRRFRPEILLRFPELDIENHPDLLDVADNFQHSKGGLDLPNILRRLQEEREQRHSP